MKELLLDAVYAGGLLVGSPWFLYKMARTGKYRSGLGERLGFVEPRAAGECIWVHGVSVGEILAARGLVAALEKELPDVEIVVSATTNTGCAVAKKTYPGKRVFYYPLDFSRAVARSFRRIRPSLVVLMEFEVWPNFLRRAEREGVSVVVANGRITDRAFSRLKRFAPFARGMLRGVTLYLMQTDKYRERLLDLGAAPERVEVTGNVKFDTLSTEIDRERAARLRCEMGVREGEILVIGGSTHASEEEALLAACAELKARDPRIRLLIVPRHKERFEEVALVIENAGCRLFRRSWLAAGRKPAGDEILLGDTMGELESLYEAADVAFVGGTLIPHGGQNMMEPAAKGKPVIFGPSVENFPVGPDLLIEAGAAVQIESGAQLARAIEAYLDPDMARAAGRAGADVVRTLKGATARTLARISEVFRQRDTGTDGL